MALNGASERFDTSAELSPDNLNSLDQGGNVYASARGGLYVDISAIRGLISGDEVVYAGTTEQLLTASKSNYIYLDSSGVLQISTSDFPAKPTGGYDYFPLAVVVCSASGITSITDRRWKFFA
jgi:hypothetical protein